MLSSFLVKNSLPASINRHLISSPAVYPAISHAVREMAPVILRYESTAPAVKPIAKTATPLSRFFDFDDFFTSPIISPASDLMHFAKTMDFDNDLRRSRFFSPGYSITSDDSMVKINVDLPGVKMDDINVEIKDDKVLQISGGRKTEEQGKKSEFHFNKRFTLGETLDKSEMKATLSDGVLTITAPNIEPVENVKRIPITRAEGNHDEEVEC